MTGIVIAGRDTSAVFQNIFDGTSIQVSWLETPAPLTTAPDFVLDLDFRPESDRVRALAAIPASLILITGVSFSLQMLGASGADERFVRINSWNTFLQRNLAEIVAAPSILPAVEVLCAAWGKRMEALPDLIGMPSARIVSMIVNEAYYAWGEGVSSRESIDTAMQLGTNYPFGPFDWSRKIGLQPIYELLVALSRQNNLYTIAPLLREEALAYGPFA